MALVCLLVAGDVSAHDPAEGTQVSLVEDSGETEHFAYRWYTVGLGDSVMAGGIPYTEGYEPLPLTRGVASSYLGRFHDEAKPEPHMVLLANTEVVYTVQATEEADDFLCAVLIPWESFMNDSSFVPDTLLVAVDEHEPARVPLAYVHGGYFALNTGTRVILSSPLVLGLDLPPGEHEIRIVGPLRKTIRYRLIVGAARAGEAQSTEASPSG